LKKFYEYNTTQIYHELMEQYTNAKRCLYKKYILRRCTKDKYYKVLDIYIDHKHIGIECQELFKRKNIITYYTNNVKSFISMYDYVNKWEIIQYQLREE